MQLPRSPRANLSPHADDLGGIGNFPDSLALRYVHESPGQLLIHRGYAPR